MKSIFAIAGIFLLFKFAAFAQIPSDANLRLQISGLSATNFSGILSDTKADVSYEFEYKLSRTHRISLGMILGSESTNWTAFSFRTTNAVERKKIRVRSWEDSDGNGIADWWELRYFGTIGIDPNGSPAGDGWSNIQKFQNRMDTEEWSRRDPPVNMTIQRSPDNRQANGVLTWQYNNYGPIPEYVVIERANRMLRPMPNNFPPGRFPAQGNNFTNRPPRPVLPMNYRMAGQPQPSIVTGPYEAIGRVAGQSTIREYHFVDSNQNVRLLPLYRIATHYPAAVSNEVPEEVVRKAARKTILPVHARPETNGFTLTVSPPASLVSCLLLVRDKNDKQWRASGYFVSGKDGGPVYLHVDKKGMMSEGQGPIAMPAVKFLPDAVQPEFIAGYGGDSDGDCLPDIYEVLVTHTDPADDDTGDTGVIDGLKKMTSDGVSNWEKFRCRIDPLRPTRPPAPVELIRPTGKEIWEAISPKSDLKCELQIDVRTNAATGYQPIEQVPWMFGKIMNLQDGNDRKNCNVRISWRFSNDFLNEHANGGYPQEYAAIKPLTDKVNIELFNEFKASLEKNPPLSPIELSNRTAEIMLSYRGGGMDKGVVMVETILLKNYQPQDFYGKVIDQDGNPLRDVSANAEITLNDGSYGGFNLKKYSTVTDSNGLFDFTGLHGAGLGVTISKPGYENEWRNDAYKGPDGGRSTPIDRTVYRMWSTNIHEALITGTQKFEIQPDGKPHFINLTDGTISDHEGGDLKVWIQYTNHVEQRQLYDWSAGIEVINGGLWEAPRVYNGFVDLGYVPMFTAAANGYVPSFSYKAQIKGGQSGEIGNRFFYLFLNSRKEYGKMGINLFAPYGFLHPGLIWISYAVNPSGSRILR